MDFQKLHCCVKIMKGQKPKENEFRRENNLREFKEKLKQIKKLGEKE